jgi:hypothetical protein
LEELLSKDNETIHPPLDGPVNSLETPRFSPDQMIRCEACLRANPPTRLNCMYCEAALPLSESSAHLRKPILRQPEKHEPGFNCILIPDRNTLEARNRIEDVASLLRLKPDDVWNIIQVGSSLPLARTANRDEAELVSERLRSLSLQTLVLSDEELGLSSEWLIRPRSFQFDEEALQMHLPGSRGVITINWSELILVVSGRIVTTRFEVTERMSRKSENDIVDTSEFFNDEAVFDLYAMKHKQTWRIGSSSFDFSCLQEQKTLVGGENLKRLYALVISKADNIKAVDDYNRIKALMEPIWPRDEHTQSRGWRRDGPGKYSLGAATLHSNEAQFTRYSRLCQYTTINPPT